MAKNERIIAQDLAEIRNAIQTRSAELDDLCKILSKEIINYPINPDLDVRVRKIARQNDSQHPKDTVREITDLIEILTAR